MTMPRVEVITSVERRRRWSREEKERLVAASLEPGVSVSDVARSAGIQVVPIARTASRSLQHPAVDVMGSLHSFEALGDASGALTGASVSMPDQYSPEVPFECSPV